MIGDKDPEDAYDVGDPINTRLDVLERIVEALESDQADPRFELRRLDALRVVDNLDDEIRTRGKQRRLHRIRHTLSHM